MVILFLLTWSPYSNNALTSKPLSVTSRIYGNSPSLLPVSQSWVPSGVAGPLHSTMWRWLPMPWCRTWTSDAWGWLGLFQQLIPWRSSAKKTCSRPVPPPLSHTHPFSIPGRQHGRAGAMTNTLGWLQTNQDPRFCWLWFSHWCCVFLYGLKTEKFPCSFVCKHLCRASLSMSAPMPGAGNRTMVAALHELRPCKKTGITKLSSSRSFSPSPDH